MGLWDLFVIIGTVGSFGAVVAGFSYLLKTALSESKNRLAIADRAPAPPLNPQWDVTVCKHPDLIPVIPSGEEEIVAYLCTNPVCLNQVELDDPAVKVNLKWNSTKAQMERHQDRVKAIRNGAQTIEQAQSFAARSRAMEELFDRSKDGSKFAQGGPVSTGSYTMQTLASEVFIPVMPDFSLIQSELGKQRIAKYIAPDAMPDMSEEGASLRTVAWGDGQAGWIEIRDGSGNIVGRTWQDAG